MKILLLWPNKEQWGSKPNSISLLSAVLKKGGHEIRLVDTTFVDFGNLDNTAVGSRARIFKPVDLKGFDLQKKPRALDDLMQESVGDWSPDLIGVSALTDEIEIGLQLTRLCKRRFPHVPVVWGNKGATLEPEKVMERGEVDYGCRGEGDEFFPEFAACVEAGGNPENLSNLVWRSEGRTRLNPLRPPRQVLDELPYFDYSPYDKRQFLKPFDGRLYRGGDHMISWGCPNSCTYCTNESLRKMYGGAAGRLLRSYGVERIVAELEYLARKWDLEFFKFHDEDFCLKPLHYLQKLAETYRARVGLPFTIMANARSVTPEKAKLLQQMGCRSVSLGIEAGNDRIRREVLQRRESRQDIVRAVRNLNDLGIRTSAFNMLGLPFETRETIRETIGLNREAQVQYPAVNFFFPYPGTRLYETAVQHGFYDPNQAAVYRSDEPALKFPELTREELILYRERFVLFVKMPEEYWSFIERSIRTDAVGRRLANELYRIYDEAVFQHGGKWPAERDTAQDFRILRTIEKEVER
ncbi:MAG: radical SAM protein [Verrucomicrobiae bacterium]|nr:radical SAM protein [Verrucomicrobiae bacterium]